MKTKLAATGGAPAQTFVDDVFSTTLYTGNGSTQTITNGIDLAGKGGLVWIKGRGQLSGINVDNILFDSARGASKILYSNLTDAGNTTSWSTAFNSNGVSFNTASGYVNSSSLTVGYASWTFRKAAKFFDVVTWTGDGVDGRSIAHNLGVSPGIIIIKRTDSGSNWKLSLKGIYNLCLNLTNAEDTTTFAGGVSGSYTSTTFNLYSYSGILSSVNASGGTYVAYLFAHDTDADGIIQCGSYNHTGGADSTITLGWEPQFILVKRTDNTSNWFMIDSMRGFTMNQDARLYADSSAAETSSDNFNPTATGFIQKGVFDTGTYIYMTIRIPNKPPTTGTQVFSPVARTGTGAAATVSGVGFPTDLVFHRARLDNVVTPANMWQDRLRGIQQYLKSNNTNQEFPDTAGILTLTMDGMTVGIDSSESNVNVSTATYINYFFKRAPGFFDEVCYTGTGSATTQAHNLTVVPEMMIVKSRSTTGNWQVAVVNPVNSRFYVGDDAANEFSLNNTRGWGASSYNVAPYFNETMFKTDTFWEASTNGTTYVAYLFATLAGISKVGSYTGNGGTQAINCGFTAGARFVLIKRTDSTGNWYTFDSARGLTSGSSPYLLLNSTAAEVTGNNGVYASTGGFTLGSTASTTTNINGASYIFLAVS
jgi:hypothetical protein